LFVCTAAAQSAPGPAGAPPPAPAPQPAKTEVLPTSITSTPSRFVSPPEMEAFVKAKITGFLILSRATDPFGQLQDPNAKPVVKTPVVKATQRTPQFQATPFSDIVRKIVVNTIMPKEKRFLVGTRSIAQGEQVALNFRGKQIRIQVLEVTSQNISFRNIESGEIAIRKMEMLPPGMTPGKGGLSAPGMIAERKNAPIDLESGETTDQTSTNR
jgi:hypothetical protein